MLLFVVVCFLTVRPFFLFGILNLERVDVTVKLICTVSGQMTRHIMKILHKLASTSSSRK